MTLGELLHVTKVQLALCKVTVARTELSVRARYFSHLLVSPSVEMSLKSFKL